MKQVAVQVQVRVKPHELSERQMMSTEVMETRTSAHTACVCVCVCPRPAWRSPREAEMMAAWSSHPGCQRKCPHPTNEKHKDHQKWSVRLCHENKTLTWRDDSKLWVWWCFFVFFQLLLQGARAFLISRGRSVSDLAVCFLSAFYGLQPPLF